MKYTSHLGLKKPEPNDYFDQENHANYNMDVIDSNITSHLVSHVKIEFSEIEPQNPNSNTFWIRNVGETDFNLGGEGGGIAVLNATNSDIPPDSDLWFENI
ncbi:hypothetical protein [Geosporobacter ferrireducens]|uniref:Uncharacterized protein n=1 Tax=Geosporobacter ferrireducens TaxID=1424294 RepID=A0A1D8GIE1_9FIRM|nr:hypothetical protein [Geosporobacter ferrireducens]AOT70678.1 hypothetical protein Gferi_14510 [Geosporobacter ferrireducens]